MPFAWSMLRKPEPTTLAPARALAHRAVQWLARAARANLPAAADDSHTSLTWDPGTAALLSQPLPHNVRIGLRIAGPALLFLQKGAVADALALSEKRAAYVDQWLDAQLAQAGLARASAFRLPYDFAKPDFAQAARYAPHLAALAHWYAAAAKLLEAQRPRFERFTPGPGPVRGWPHHFDMAMLVALEEGPAERAKSIGMGFSPGDVYYAEPYFYLSAYPRPEAGSLPPLPPGGRWHAQDQFSAVATATDLLALPDPRQAVIDVLDAAFEAAARRLHRR